MAIGRRGHAQFPPAVYSRAQAGAEVSFSPLAARAFDLLQAEEDLAAVREAEKSQAALVTRFDEEIAASHAAAMAALRDDDEVTARRRAADKLESVRKREVAAQEHAQAVERVWRMEVLPAPHLLETAGLCAQLLFA